MRSHTDFDGSCHHHLAFVLVSAWGLVLSRLFSRRQWVRQDTTLEWCRAQAGCPWRGGGLRVSVRGTCWSGRGRGRATASTHSRAWPLTSLGSTRCSAPELTDQLILDKAEDVLDSAAFFWLSSKQPLKHAQSIISEAAPLRWICPHRTSCFLPAPKLFVKGIDRQRCLPGEIARQHTEYQHTKSPHIQTGGHKETFCTAGTTHFWCCVGDGSTHPFHTAAHAPGHAKVSQFDAATFAVKQEHIFRFDIPMYQVFTVHKVQGQSQLLHAAFDHFLLKTHLRVGQREGKEQVLRDRKREKYKIFCLMRSNRYGILSRRWGYGRWYK